MAQLTSDIVWLVEQNVTLADGSSQRVLVPQVYVRVKPGDIDGSGALLSADTLRIQNEAGQGDVVNSGTLAGRNLVALTADNVHNLGGRITGASVGVNARTDLANIGGTIDAQNAAVLTAGRDIRIASTTQTAVGPQGSATALDRLAAVYVSNPGGTLVARAGQDVQLVGAMLSNTGEGGLTSVQAGRDIQLDTLKTRSNQDTTWNAKNYQRTPAGDVSISASKVDILEARETNNSQTETRFKQSGLTLALTSPIISAIETAQQMGQAASRTSSTRMKVLAAANVGMGVNNAVNAVKAGQGTTIDGKDNQIATGNKNLDGTAETRDATAAEKAGGINLSISIGASSSQSKRTQSSDSARGSTVAAGGNVSISASGAGADSDLLLQGAKVKAGHSVSLHADDAIDLLRFSANLRSLLEFPAEHVRMQKIFYDLVASVKLEPITPVPAPPFVEWKPPPSKAAR